MQAAASIALLLMSVSTQPGMAQQQTTPAADGAERDAPAPPQAVQNDTTGQAGLPQAPAPKLTEPLYLRDTGIDYTKPKSHLLESVGAVYGDRCAVAAAGEYAAAGSLLRDGKIYLSLSDAVTLALENNYDIAIARINLDIADTDILRAKAGSTLRGVSTGLVHEYAGRHDARRLPAAADRAELRLERAAAARVRADWC